MIDKYNKNRKKVCACFVDFKKAFDSVDHSGMLLKQRKSGIGDRMYNIIKSMYLNQENTLCVKSGQTLTNKFNCNVGVKQGEPLSPILFNLYINDMMKHFDNTCQPIYLDNTPLNSLLYADDLILLSETESGLQKCIEKLETFCSKWALEVNKAKTKCMVFTSNGRNEKTNIKLNGELLETVRTYKYLGIVFSSSGSFTNAIEDLYKRGLKANFKLCSLLDAKNINFNTAMHLFDHTVKPVLMYGAEIWSPFLLKRKESPEKLFKFTLTAIYEKCQQKFCRFMLGVGKKAPNISLYSETGKPPFIIDALTTSYRFLHRLEQHKPNSLLGKALVENNQLMIQNKETWVKYLYQLLNTLRINWENRSTNSKQCQAKIKEIKKCLIAKFNSFWANEINTDIRSKNLKSTHQKKNI